MASSEEYYLLDQELLFNRPNSRIAVIQPGKNDTNSEVPFLVFCNNDKLNLKGAIPIVLHNGIWHRFKPSKKAHTLGELLPSIHNFDTFSV
jgi:hypothetical protein